jgi:hypothetical protein
MRETKVSFSFSVIKDSLCKNRQEMPSKTLEMHNLFVKSNPRLYYTLDLSCASCWGCGLS